MTYYLDTNCILRFLANDVPAQAERIEKRFRSLQKHQNVIVVSHVVIVECIFQLEHWYKLSRDEASEKMIAFLAPDWIHVDDKPHVLFGLQWYKSAKIDFVDVLIYTLAKGRNAKILSFDKDFDTITPKLREEP
ncbi:MAG: PIN domain-containing protein [Patescibacteria group bacterium]|nr:PIN domain-containing protein [Patescibacteria group bacterium]